MIIVVFLKLPILVKAASSVLILTYMFSCLSVIIMRESRLQNYQPIFRTPLYPWIQIVGIIGFGFLLFEMGKEALLMVSVFILGGLFVYWFYGRIRSSREYALLHLVERITAKELTTHSLETELKEIIRERDDIVKDRFDHIVEESLVLDINQSITLEEFFRLVADSMSKRLEINADTLYQALIKRERENTTVLNPDLAVPHIVIEGEHKFISFWLAASRESYFQIRHPKSIQSLCWSEQGTSVTFIYAHLPQLPKLFKSSLLNEGG